MAKKTVEVEVYTATAPFTQNGKTYQVGDEFEVPAGWVRDAAYEEIINQKKGSRKVCFSSPEIEEDKATHQAYVPGRRNILPVSETAPAPVKA